MHAFAGFQGLFAATSKSGAQPFTCVVAVLQQPVAMLHEGVATKRGGVRPT